MLLALVRTHCGLEPSVRIVAASNWRQRSGRWAQARNESARAREASRATASAAITHGINRVPATLQARWSRFALCKIVATNSANERSLGGRGARRGLRREPEQAVDLDQRTGVVRDSPAAVDDDVVRGQARRDVGLHG